MRKCAVEDMEKHVKSLEGTRSTLEADLFQFNLYQPNSCQNKSIANMTHTHPTTPPRSLRIPLRASWLVDLKEKSL